ncbi:MAG: hypothetical protein R3C13_04260 [Hyphomonas sp.]|uniref:hypothetical protein n=1 Tax=Hyphomonas sp. TaxID=87 RepID=UPI00352987F6
MSPFCPPAGFPPHLCLIWPLIWAQILVLRGWVRAVHGKGTHYRWSVTVWGQVFLVRIVGKPGEAEEEGAELQLAALIARACRRIGALSLGEPDWPEALRTHPERSRSLVGVLAGALAGTSPQPAVPIRGPP